MYHIRLGLICLQTYFENRKKAPVNPLVGTELEMWGATRHHLRYALLLTDFSAPRRHGYVYAPE